VAIGVSVAQTKDRPTTDVGSIAEAALPNVLLRLDAASAVAARTESAIARATGAAAVRDAKLVSGQGADALLAKVQGLVVVAGICPLVVCGPCGRSRKGCGGRLGGFLAQTSTV